MREGLLATLGVVVVSGLVASCATGSSLPPGGNGGAGGTTGSTASASSSSSASSTSGGGMGGATTSSTSGTGGTSGSMSSTSSSSSSSSSSASSTSGGCSASPCKVTSPQCGCTGNNVCTIANGAVACGPGGTQGDGQSCGTGTTDLCAAGFVCVTASAATGQCLEFCDADNDCTPPGGICLLELDDGFGGTIPNVKICTPNCNLMTNTGCPAGSGCDLRRESAGLMRWLTLCSDIGTKTQGQACNPSIPDCAASHLCLDLDGFGDKCLHYCNVNAPSCPAGTFCDQLFDSNFLPITLGNVTVGACD